VWGGEGVGRRCSSPFSDQREEIEIIREVTRELRFWRTAADADKILKEKDL